jgi:regulator of sirC expression with transglutaminase-like and TPR domain
LKKKPKFAQAYRPRSQVRAKLQDLKGAIADYKEAMRLQPTAM